MQVFMLVLNVVRSAIPLPNFQNATEVAGWWAEMANPVGALVAAIVDQIQETGEARIELPGGGCVVLEVIDGKCCYTQSQTPQLLAEACYSADEEDGRVGDSELPGSWLTVVQLLLPVILQVIDRFFDKKDAEPVPAV